MLQSTLITQLDAAAQFHGRTVVVCSADGFSTLEQYSGLARLASTESQHHIDDCGEQLTSAATSVLTTAICLHPIAQTTHP